MKKNYPMIFVLLLLCITTLNAQKVLVTDDASLTTPATLLHVHKTGSSAADLIQLTNGATGTSSSNGLKFSVKADKTFQLKNLENSDLEFYTNNLLRMTIKSDGKVNIAGDLAYSFIHGAMYLENGTYSPSVDQNTYTRINPGMTVSEADGMTLSSDQITILTAGDYKIDIVLTLSGTSGDDYRVKMYKNGSATGIPGSNRISTSGTSNYVVLPYFWYAGFAANDVISFWITNTSSDNNPTISDMKVYIEKKPE
jgi:hypothetical protein